MFYKQTIQIWGEVHISSFFFLEAVKLSFISEAISTIRSGDLPSSEQKGPCGSLADKKHIPNSLTFDVIDNKTVFDGKKLFICFIDGNLYFHIISLSAVFSLKFKWQSHGPTALNCIFFGGVGGCVSNSAGFSRETCCQPGVSDINSCQNRIYYENIIRGIKFRHAEK